MRLRLALALPLLLLAACGGEVEAVSRRPGKTVVLTFDDSATSQLTTVVPVLESVGFGATFFVCPRFREEHGNAYLDWEGMAELHRRGFEVGNHSWGHLAFNYPECCRHLREDTAMMETRLASVGVPKPVSFAWPGDGFGPEALAILEEAGYRFARRGRAPEVAPDMRPVPGPVYVPNVNHPLLVPTTIAVGPEWTLADVRRALATGGEGRVVVFQFHGVPDPVNPQVSISPARFSDWMFWLKREGWRGIALRDLEPYVDRSVTPADPLAKLAWPDPEKVPFGAGGGPPVK